uniref:Ubiquitin-like protease family profile domain-containing protein n=1 Tax=Vitis vinifera TaxID=29760 RepID=A5BNJ5_VITVI|nr:hypothetical protein VITISV_010135 [Vitis vinifera]
MKQMNVKLLSKNPNYQQKGQVILLNRTISGLQQALENRVSKYQGKKQQKCNIALEAYSLVGFPYVFQVWVYETIPIIEMKYANHVDKSCPRILNWSATSTPRFTELQQIFLDSNLSLCSLLKPTMEECQQDYYKHLNKLELVNATAYVAAVAIMENKNKKDYSIPPSIENLWIEFMKHIEKSKSNSNYLKKELKEMNRKIDKLRQLLLDVKGQNESCAIDNTKFSKSGPKGKDIGMDFNSLDDKFETMMEDKEDENHDHIDVKTNTEEITIIVAAEKHIIGMEKDDDVIFDPIVDISKLFDTATVSSNFSVYKYVKARWEKHAKKWNQFQMQANDILVDYVNGFHPIPSMKWFEVDIVYVPINVRTKVLLRILHATSYYGKSGEPKSEEQWDIERLHDVPQQEYDGDCGMFLIKYVEYLMHDNPFSSLTGARIDWFREKMATELFYFKI